MASLPSLATFVAELFTADTFLESAFRLCVESIGRGKDMDQTREHRWPFANVAYIYIISGYQQPEMLIRLTLCDYSPQSARSVACTANIADTPLVVPSSLGF